MLTRTHFTDRFYPPDLAQKQINCIISPHNTYLISFSRHGYMRTEIWLSSPNTAPDWPCCMTCQIHLPTTSNPSSITILWFTIRGQATSESSHQNYRLCCIYCTDYSIGMITNQLSNGMNSHHQTMGKSKVEHCVATHAAEHNMLYFNSYFTTWVI